MVKVIASSLRKGNVIEKDGKLYSVLFAENIHPGKGTPVTQLDMRRISDGVKVSERYRTTEQVERALVEDRPYNYLYQDGEGFHFMNPENYDQVVASEDIIGDAAPYLTDGCTVKLSTHDGVPIAIELPRLATFGGLHHELPRLAERHRRDQRLEHVPRGGVAVHRHAVAAVAIQRGGLVDERLAVALRQHRAHVLDEWLVTDPGEQPRHVDDAVVHLHGLAPPRQLALERVEQRVVIADPARYVIDPRTLRELVPAQSLFARRRRCYRRRPARERVRACPSQVLS